MIEINVFKDEIASKILCASNCHCVLCEETNKASLVFHEVVPGAMKHIQNNGILDRYPDTPIEDRLVVLCRPCAVKIETLSTSPYVKILETNLWNKIPDIKNQTYKPMFSGLLTKVRKMAHMNRFAPEIYLRPEDVAEHSYWVALLSLAIADEYVKTVKIDRLKLLTMSLFHDMIEIFTTDVPTPIKRSTRGTDVFYEKVEKKAGKELEKLLGYHNLTNLIDELEHSDSIEAQIVRVADRVSAIIYSAEEAFLGNRSFNIIIRRYYESIVNTLDDRGNQPAWYTELYLDLHTWLKSTLSPKILDRRVSTE
jgi:5'-deoxynucleotidase YfbR-like HD superfamily hydrolase